MSLLSENVIPGNHGKVFGTNAKTEIELKRVQNAMIGVDGVKDVILNDAIFPREITVHTEKMVKVIDIEVAVIKSGFHVIPKGLFSL